MPLVCDFPRLLKKAAAEQENHTAQKNSQLQCRHAPDALDNTQNRQNETVFHFFLSEILRPPHSGNPLKITLFG